MDKATQQREFKFVAENPGPWLLQAYWLRHAADRVDWIKSADAGALILHHVYLFLIGQATENLLKGIIIAHGKSLLGKNGEIRFSGHNLAALAREIDSRRFAINSREWAILERLSKYVTFAGRYPIAKRPEHVFGSGHSSEDYKAELGLFHRLFEHLHYFGWWLYEGDQRVLTMDYGLLDGLPNPADC